MHIFFLLLGPRSAPDSFLFKVIYIELVSLIFSTYQELFANLPGDHMSCHMKVVCQSYRSTQLSRLFHLSLSYHISICRSDIRNRVDNSRFVIPSDFCICFGESAKLGTLMICHLGILYLHYFRSEYTTAVVYSNKKVFTSLSGSSIGRFSIDMYILPW